MDRILEVLGTKDRILVTLAGIPGSGKSTLALKLVNELQAAGISAAVVGMDGYHYTRADLATRIGVERAIKFRGAPYTFDAPAVLNLAKSLATDTHEIRFPTFDHALKDPVPNAGVVPENTRVVILEGLYVQLKDKYWCDISKWATDTWFINTDFNVARDRLAKRHLSSGIVNSLEEGYARADENDLVNGRYILENSVPAKYIVN